MSSKAEQDPNIGVAVGAEGAGVTHVVIDNVEYLVAEGIITGKA